MTSISDHTAVSERTPDQSLDGADHHVPARRHQAPAWFYTVAIAVAILAIAEVSARQEWVSDLVLPAPSDVATALIDGTTSGLFLPAVISTVTATLLGFLISTGIALSVAAVLSGIPFLERVMLPFIIGFQTLPKIAIAPLVILWLGFGGLGKVTIVTIVCFFPILVNSLEGLKIRDRDRYELFLSLGASRWLTFRHLRLPTAVPYIFAGLHIGIIFALIGAVTAEFVGSRSGLGYVLIQNKAAFNVPGVFSVLVLFMLVGLVMDGLMRLVERRLSRWTGSVTSAVG